MDVSHRRPLIRSHFWMCSAHERRSTSLTCVRRWTAARTVEARPAVETPRRDRTVGIEDGRNDLLRARFDRTPAGQTGLVTLGVTLEVSFRARVRRRTLHRAVRPVEGRRTRLLVLAQQSGETKYSPVHRRTLLSRTLGLPVRTLAHVVSTSPHGIVICPALATIGACDPRCAHRKMLTLRASVTFA